MSITVPGRQDFDKVLGNAKSAVSSAVSGSCACGCSNCSCGSCSNCGSGCR